LWADQKNVIPTSAILDDDNSSITSTSCDDSTSSSNSAISITENYTKSLLKTRYQFDSTMYDCLGCIITIKVFSHQLNEDFTTKVIGKKPCPNLFVISANQLADNAATQAQKLYETIDTDDLTCNFYPPFSPRWSFSFEGRLTNKGATKILYEKMDDELILRQQHCAKQGLLFRMAPFNSLSAAQIGEESLLRNLMKMTAPCWTRSIYRYPPLATQIWHYWQTFEQNESTTESSPSTLPKSWKNKPVINDIIKACPFCSHTFGTDNKKGTLGHLHLYCPSMFLQRVHAHCNQKLEEAIYQLYNFASLNECSLPLHEITCATTLQENMIATAKESELQVRPIVRSAHGP
jgi:hypothetical protein